MTRMIENHPNFWAYVLIVFPLCLYVWMWQWLL